MQIIGRLLGRHKNMFSSDGRSRKMASHYKPVRCGLAVSVCARVCVFRFVAMCLSKDKWKSISHLSCSMKMQRKYDTWHMIWINGFDTGPTGSMLYLSILHANMSVCAMEIYFGLFSFISFFSIFSHFIKWHFDLTWCLNTVHDSRTRLSRIAFRCVCVCLCLILILFAWQESTESSAHSHTTHTEMDNRIEVKQKKEKWVTWESA